MKQLISLGLLLALLLVCVPLSLVTCDDDDSDETPTPTPTPTPPQVSISGTVYDGGYNPRPNIRILCGGKETTTDQNGHYSLANVPGGKKMVHAIWDFYGMLLVQTKVAESERYDFLFRNVIALTWDYGTIQGTVSGMTDSYPDSSYILVQDVGPGGIIMMDVLDQSTANYRLLGAPVGNNAVIAYENDFVNYVLTRQTAADPVTVTAGQTTTQDLVMSSAGFETVSGSYCSNYKSYSGEFFCFLNTVSPPFFCYHTEGGEISAGYSRFYSGVSGTYSFTTLPAYCSAEKVTQIDLSNYQSGSAVFKRFFNSKKNNGSNTIDFPEDPEWLYITSSQPEASNVGDYPLFTWSGTGKKYLIELWGYNENNDYLNWWIETADQEFQVPELPDIRLTTYSECMVSIISKSCWNADFAAINPPLPDEVEFRANETMFFFYPGAEPTSPLRNENKLKRLDDLQSRHNQLPQKTTDGRYLFRLPISLEQSH